MKKSLRFFSLLLIAVMLLPAMTFAQQMPPMGTDPDVRIGKLPNGLTYYIRHNDKPKGQADFYIAQKVGSILEDDSQRGLAHFLEHMCFNGTTHFPGKNLINYLESVGVKFGRNLNAYTSIDQTVYNISNVPTARIGTQDSCLLILHDWADDLLLLPAEIDAERAVIHEEWRTSNVGQMRILEQILPSIYAGEKYGYRLPIGTMEVVDNFPHQALRDYYEKWYRPDQQGVIVVGDIDVDRIENKIKELFSSIKMPENVAERVYFPVKDTEGTIYAIGHDKEMTVNVASLMIKSDPMPRELNNTALHYAQDYMMTLIVDMLDTRLNEISSKPGAPFVGAGVNYGEFLIAKTKDCFDLTVQSKTGADLPSALAAAYREVLRAARGGFTVTEFDRAKAEYLSRYERAYNGRNDRENSVYVNQYVDNFLDNDPIPAMEETYNTVKMFAQQIPLEAINATFKEMVTPDNRVMMALLADNAENVYPTEQQFADALAAVDAENIEAYKEDVKSEPLIENLPKPGKIVKTTELPQWGATEWTLSNGARVIVKPTKFKEDEIRFTATALNGTATLGKEYDNDVRAFNDFIGSCGLGTYTNTDLRKYLSGKQCGVGLRFSAYNRNISGFTTPKDLRYLMELIYMNFTNVNFTPDEFAALKEQNISNIENQEKEPMNVFRKYLMQSIFPDNNRGRLSDVPTIEAASRDNIINIARRMTENAADYTFIFVGNVNVDTLKQLTEKYIACLPGNAKKAVKKRSAYAPQYLPVAGTRTDSYTTPMETPQTWAYITRFGTMPLDTKNTQLASIAGQILSKRLLDIVREEKGAVYSIGANGQIDGDSPLNVEIVTAFPMKPEMKDEVLTIINEQVNKLATDISQAELDKAKEFMTKTYKENLEKNGPWLNGISEWISEGVDTFNGTQAVLDTVTVDDVKNFMKNLNAQGDYHVIILDPETK